MFRIKSKLKGKEKIIMFLKKQMPRMDTATWRKGSIGLNEKTVKKGQRVECKTTGKSIRKIMKVYKQKTEWKSQRKLEKWCGKS